MAIRPIEAYPGKTSALDSAYPHGKAQNIQVEGDGTGTPLEAAWLNDLWGFEQALLASASIVPSGQADRVGASQYLDALNAIITKAVRGAVRTLSGSTHIHSNGGFEKAGYDWMSAANEGFCWFEITDALPAGATLTQAEVKVTPGAAPITVAERMQFQLFRRRNDTLEDIPVGSVFTTSSVLGAQTVLLAALNHAVDISQNTYHIRIRANSAGATSLDLVHWSRITSV